MMKDKELRSKLQGLGLPTDGHRKVRGLVRARAAPIMHKARHTGRLMSTLAKPRACTCAMPGACVSVFCVCNALRMCIRMPHACA